MFESGSVQGRGQMFPVICNLEQARQTRVLAGYFIIILKQLHVEYEVEKIKRMIEVGGDFFRGKGTDQIKNKRTCLSLLWISEIFYIYLLSLGGLGDGWGRGVCRAGGVWREQSIS